MIPLKLSLYNFMSYKNPEPLDFTGFSLACLCGPNGAGKSSILDAITFALWGESRTSSDDDLIHHGQNGMWVEFEFKLGNNEYKVVRKRDKRKRGQSELSFFIKEKLGWASLTESTLKETQEKIEKILHLPYEIFENSAYLRQGHADEFTRKTSSQRKEILGEVLGLDFYENLSGACRAKVRDKEIESQNLASLISEIKLSLEEKPEIENEYQKTTRQRQRFETEFRKENEKLKILEKDKQKIDLLNSKLEDIRLKISEIIEEGQSLKIEVKGYEEEIKELSKIKEKGEEIEKNYQKLKVLLKENEKFAQKFEESAEITTSLSVLKNKEETLESQVKKIQKIGKCPTCLRPMTEKDGQKIIEHLRKDFQKKYAPKISEFKETLEKIGYDKEKHQKIKNEIDRLEIFEEKKNQLEIAKESLKSKKEYLKKTRENLEKRRLEYKKATIEKQKFETEFVKLKPVEAKWQEKQEKVESLSNELFEIKEKIGGLKEKIEYIKKQEKLYEEKSKNLEKLIRETALLKELAEIFSKKGIQARILETAIPEIEEEANRILGKITNGRMSLKFETQRAKKTSEEIIETLDITIADEIGDRDYELYSGGEAFKIDLAIRIALSKILSKRAGAKLQFLVIDEGFGTLDVAGQDAVVSAINGIKDEFEKILVVTHIQELKDAFPARIEVNKDENGSHLKVVSV